MGWLEANDNVVRLKQAEWLERQEKLFAMGGPCDAPTWDECDAWQAQQGK